MARGDPCALLYDFTSLDRDWRNAIGHRDTRRDDLEIAAVTALEAVLVPITLNTLYKQIAFTTRATLQLPPSH
jgi:hypothetical protein